MLWNCPLFWPGITNLQIVYVYTKKHQVKMKDRFVVYFQVSVE